MKHFADSGAPVLMRGGPSTRDHQLNAATLTLTAKLSIVITRITQDIPRFQWDLGPTALSA